jgi:hypothetical protein
MKQKKSKKMEYWFSVIAIGVALGFTLQFARAWIDPPQNPPAGNLGAPINTSTNDQTKGNATSGTIFAKDFCLNSDPTSCLSNAGNTTCSCREVESQSIIILPVWQYWPYCYHYYQINCMNTVWVTYQDSSFIGSCSFSGARDINCPTH